MSELSLLQTMDNSSWKKPKDLELRITREKGHFREQVSGLHRGQPGSRGGKGDRDKSSSVIGKLPKEKEDLPKGFVRGWSPALLTTGGMASSGNLAIRDSLRGGGGQKFTQGFCARAEPGTRQAAVSHPTAGGPGGRWDCCQAWTRGR